jgi:hypothetical protein
MGLLPSVSRTIPVNEAATPAETKKSHDRLAANSRLEASMVSPVVGLWFLCGVMQETGSVYLANKDPRRRFQA